MDNNLRKMISCPVLIFPPCNMSYCQRNAEVSRLSKPVDSCLPSTLWCQQVFLKHKTNFEMVKYFVASWLVNVRYSYCVYQLSKVHWKFGEQVLTFCLQLAPFTVVTCHPLKSLATKLQIMLLLPLESRNISCGSTVILSSKLQPVCILLGCSSNSVLEKITNFTATYSNN